MDPSISKLFQEQYEDNWYFAARAEVLTAFIRHFAKIGPGRHIADLGAGTGGILVKLASEAFAVGLEENEHLIREGRRRYGLLLVRANLVQGIPFREEVLDLVLMLDVIEHVEDVLTLLTSVKRVLRPGAEIIVSVPAFRALWSHHDELHHHKRRYCKAELCEVLRAAGFLYSRVTYFNSFLLPVIFVSRKLEKLSRSWARSASDYEKAPAIMSRLLRWIFSQERHFITRCGFPVGVSLVAVAKKP